MKIISLEKAGTGNSQGTEQSVPVSHLSKYQKWLGRGFWVGLAILAVLLGDDLTVVGALDDFLIPFNIAELGLAGTGWLLLRRILVKKAQQFLINNKV